MAVWIVFYNEFLESQDSDKATSFTLPEIRSQLVAARKLFPRTTEGASRLNGFRTEFPDTNTYQTLPKNKHAICSRLDILRRGLILQYEEVEKVLHRHHSIGAPGFENDIYDLFKDFFASSQTSEYTLACIPNHMKF